MLEKGEISAMMTPHPPKPVLRGSKKIKRLFADPKAEDLRYYKKNGFFPIMHVVAFKDDVLKKYPEAAAEFVQRVRRRQENLPRVLRRSELVVACVGPASFRRRRKLLGPDPWPYGLEKNRANLERFVGYSLDQGLMAKKMAAEELFLPLN